MSKTHQDWSPWIAKESCFLFHLTSDIELGSDSSRKDELVRKVFDHGVLVDFLTASQHAARDCFEGGHCRRGRRKCSDCSCRKHMLGTGTRLLVMVDTRAE
ncbi:hypothetical protein ACLOJK_020802 [Asimina triloba]